MIRLYVKKGIYDYERIIFPESVVASSADITRYMRFYHKPKGQESVEWDTYRTPIILLTEDLEAIRSRYTKELRYEVRRAGRENIRYLMSCSPGEDLIRDLHAKYLDFCDTIQQPKLKSNFDAQEMQLMANAGNLYVTRADYENGWVYHIYQVDGETAMLWFSFSDYRLHEGSKSLAGYANRGLHDADIVYFKSNGFQRYDWGNISSETEPNEIDKFKLSFGGKVETVYCCFIGNTWKGKLLIALRKIKAQ